MASAKNGISVAIGIAAISVNGVISSQAAKTASRYDRASRIASAKTTRIAAAAGIGVMAAAMASGGINGMSNQRRGISWRNRRQNVKKNYGINNVRKQWQRMAKWRSAGGGIAYQTAA
jgi:hypothetical protein